MIEYVKDFPAELQFKPFGKPGGFQDVRVKLPEPGPAKGISATRSNGARDRIDEGLTDVGNKCPLRIVVMRRCNAIGTQHRLVLSGRVSTRSSSKRASREGRKDAADLPSFP